LTACEISTAVPNPTLATLQQQLREKFPRARHGLAPTPADSATPDFDLLNPASFPRGGITEIVPAHPAAGLSLVVAAMLEHEPAPSSVPELALIDGRDNFDPASFPPEDCAKLLWIRCQTPEQSIKAADLILRDGNLPRVVIDLLAFSLTELRTAIPDSVWHRLKQLIEINDLSVICLSPRPLVPCACMRLSMHSGFGLGHLASDRTELIRQLRGTPVLQRKRAQ
jgi:hypothetical protein